MCQYHIPTAKSSCASPVAMELGGLCTIHHMTMAETSKFCRSLLYSLTRGQPVGPGSSDPTTINMLEHCQLPRDPWYKTTWDTLTSNELGCLCQGIGSGKAPSSKSVASTNTFFCINYNSILLHKMREICHTMVVYSNQKRMTLTAHKSPLVATASVTLAMWVPTQHPWNCSSSSSTVYSREKVHALAPLILRTSS
jgi:hypothetical protein